MPADSGSFADARALTDADSAAQFDTALPALPCSAVPSSVKDGGLIPTDAGSTDAGSVSVAAGAAFSAFGVSPNVAVGKDGSAIVSWEAYNGSVNRYVGWVRRYVNAQWMEPELIGIVDGPVTVAAGSNGGAVAVYYEYSGLELFAICARVFTPSVGWSDPSSVGTASEGWWQDPVAPLPRVGMDGAGNAIVVWATNAGWNQTSATIDGAVAARRYTPGTGWGALVPFSAPRQFLSAPALAVTPPGTALAAWSIGSPDSSVVGVAFDPNTGWTTPEVIAAQGTAPALAPESNGEISAAWGRYTSFDRVTIETTQRGLTGTWSPVASPGGSSLGADANSVLTWALAMQTGGAGNDAVAWSISDTPCSVHSYVSVRDPSLGWLTQQEMQGTSGEPVQLSALGVSPTGQALVLLHDGCIMPKTYARWYRPGSGWLSAALLDDSTDYESVAMAPDGRALIVGTEVAPTNDAIVARWLTPP